MADSSSIWPPAQNTRQQCVGANWGRGGEPAKGGCVGSRASGAFAVGAGRAIDARGLLRARRCTKGTGSYGETVDSAAPNHLIEHAEGPAFHGPRWNGWVVAALAILCIFAFFGVQTIIFAYVIFKDHPEFVRNTNELLRQLADPQFVPKILTAKNLWLMSVISEAALALMTIGFAQAVLRATPVQLGLGARRGAPFWVLAGIGAGTGLFVVSLIIEGVITAIFGPHPQPQSLVVASHHGAVDFALDFMSVAIAAPIAEEIFFRGFVFAGL